GICLAPPSSRFIRPLRHSLISFTHFREPAASVFAQSTVSHPSGGLFRSYTCLLPHAQVIWHSSASFRKRCRQAKIGTNSFGFVFRGMKLAPITLRVLTQLVIIFAGSVGLLIGGYSVCHEASLQLTLFATLHYAYCHSAPCHPPPPRVWFACRSLGLRWP